MENGEEALFLKIISKIFFHNLRCHEFSGVYQIKNSINENKSTSRDVTKKLQKKSNIRGKKS